MKVTLLNRFYQDPDHKAIIDIFTDVFPDIPVAERYEYVQSWNEQSMTFTSGCVDVISHEARLTKAWNTDTNPYPIKIYMAEFKDNYGYFISEGRWTLRNEGYTTCSQRGGYNQPIPEFWSGMCLPNTFSIMAGIPQTQQCQCRKVNTYIWEQDMSLEPYNANRIKSTAECMCDRPEFITGWSPDLKGNKHEDCDFCNRKHEGYIDALIWPQDKAEELKIIEEIASRS